jgi:hypothetical protein
MNNLNAFQQTLQDIHDAHQKEKAQKAVEDNSSGEGQRKGREEYEKLWKFFADLQGQQVGSFTPVIDKPNRKFTLGKATAEIAFGSVETGGKETCRITFFVSGNRRERSQHIPLADSQGTLYWQDETGAGKRTTDDLASYALRIVYTQATQAAQ